MSLETLKVLIVDDSPEDAEIVTDALATFTSYHCDCIAIDNAHKALQELQYNNYDLVLLDYNMPGNDGLWVLSELQLECLTVPIVFMTGAGDERVAVKALKLGATDYICKHDIQSQSLQECVDYAIKRKKEDLAFLARATRDPLTGVMARYTFMETLEQTVTRAERSQNRFALLFIDLNKFKPINDRLGHNAGDQVLIEVTQRISASLRKCDTLARIGGDEFVVIVEDLGCNCTANSAVITKRIAHSIADAVYYVEGQEVSLGAAIGVAMFPASGGTGKELLNAADEAMYECKKADDVEFVHHASCQHLLEETITQGNVVMVNQAARRRF